MEKDNEILVDVFLAKTMIKFSELEEDLESWLERNDPNRLCGKFELVLTLNEDTQLRVFEEGVQVKYL